MSPPRERSPFERYSYRRPNGRGVLVMGSHPMTDEERGALAFRSVVG